MKIFLILFLAIGAVISGMTPQLAEGLFVPEGFAFLSKSFAVRDSLTATVTMLPIHVLADLEIPVKDAIGVLVFELPNGWNTVSLTNVTVSGKCRRGQDVDGTWADLYIWRNDLIIKTVRYEPFILLNSSRLLIIVSAYLDTSTYHVVSLNSKISSISWEFNSDSR